MRNHTKINRLSALAAAALSLGVASVASAQTTPDTSATPPAASTPATPDATATPPDAGTPATPDTTTITPAPVTPASPDNAATPQVPGAPASPPTSAAAPTAPAATTPPPVPTAPAAAPTPPAPRFTYTGLLDFYYQYSFSNPKGLPNNALISSYGAYTPEYNVRQNTPSVSLAELNLVYAAPANGGLAAKATLITGDTADINHGGLGVDPSVFHEAYYKNIQQLYVSYVSKAGAGIDFGKFYTPFGYEVTESNANFNYSRSDVYTYLLPVYHAGFRAYTSNMKGLTLTGYIVNAISDTSDEGVLDDNGSKAYMGTINYTDPKGKFVAIESIGYSKDKNIGFGSIAGPDSDKITLSDTDFTYTPTATSTFGAEYVYRKDDAGSVGSLSSNGYAAYYRYQINPADAAAFRYSYVDQKQVGRPWDLTGTYEIKTVGGKFLTRFEYRYDKVYSPIQFASGTANFDKSSQSTATVSEVFTF